MEMKIRPSFITTELMSSGGKDRNQIIIQDKCKAVSAKEEEESLAASDLYRRQQQRKLRQATLSWSSSAESSYT